MPNLKVLLGAVSSEWDLALKRLAAADQGLKIVGQVADPVRLLLQAQALSADVIILSQLPDGSEPGVCSHLLLELPNVPILLLPASIGSALLTRTVLRREQLPATERALYSALRGGQ